MQREMEMRIIHIHGHSYIDLKNNPTTRLHELVGLLSSPKKDIFI